MDRGTAMLAVVLDVYEGGKDLIPGWKLKEHAERALAAGGVEGLRLRGLPVWFRPPIEDNPRR